MKAVLINKFKKEKLWQMTSTKDFQENEINCIYHNFDGYEYSSFRLIYFFKLSSYLFSLNF